MSLTLDDTDTQSCADAPSLGDRALELLPQPALILDEALRVRRANEAARRRFASPAAEDPGPPLGTLLGRAATLPSEARSRILACCAPLALGPEHGNKDAIIAVAPGHTIALHVRLLAKDRWLLVLTDRYTHADVGTGLAETERDPLTELGNRRHIEQKLAEALGDDDPDNRPAVLVFDVDGFREIAERLGRQGGDALLRAIAGRLRRATRDADEVARLDGDSFAVLQHNGLGADNLAVRLVDLLGRPYLLRGEVATVGISVGIARAPEDGAAAMTLLRNADLARKEAKEAGGHTWRRFGQTMAERARSRLELEADLRKAFAAGALTQAFQPRVNLRTRRVTGFEALARWTHVGRGAVPPGVFIPVAEDIGLIGALGDRMLRAACQAAAAWPEPLTVAVNVSGWELDDGPKYLAQTTDALRDAGLPARRLELEVTEAALARRPNEARAVLRDLHDLGIRIALDGFGGGPASLGLIRTFPFDTIAIDRNFIRTLDSSGESVAMVRAIATLGAGLGMAVAAVGVETATQARMAAADGCTDMQGFLLCKPVTAAEVPAVLARDFGAALGTAAA